MMKRLNIIAVTLLLIVIPFMQSCLDSDYEDDWRGGFPSDTDLAIATIHHSDADSPAKFYFTLDNGKTIYPAICTAIKEPTFVDGQRAFVYLRLLSDQHPEAVDGYDYNAEIFRIEEILTKKIIPLTEQTADSIGDSQINITYRWVAQGYVNFEFQYFGSNNPTKKHMLNLVYDKEKPMVDEEGYICLEFRHNAYNDPQVYRNEGLVSFHLGQVANEMKTAKGLKVRVNTIYNGIQYMKIDLTTVSENSDVSTDKQLKSIF